MKLANGRTVHLGGSVNLVGFIGHNVKMDVVVKSTPHNPGSGTRDAVVLACRSTDFRDDLALAKTGQQVLTTGLMAPEAYSLAAILDGWIAREPAPRLARRAATAYAKYQKCGLRAAQRLFAGR